MASMSKDKIKDLKFNLVLARKRPMPFGLCLGKAPEGTVLVFHKTQPPKKLGLAAKKEGETPKFTYGTMSCDGKDLSLSCQGDVLAGLARKLKLFLKSANINMKIQILDPDGTMLEEDGDADEDASGDDDRVAVGSAPADASGSAPAGAADDGGDGGDGDDWDGAGDIDDDTDDDTGDTDGAASPDPMAAEWDIEEPRVAALVRNFLKDGLEDADDIRDRWDRAAKAKIDGEIGKALEFAAQTAVLVRDALQAREFKIDDQKKWIEMSQRLRSHVEEAIDEDTPVARKIRGLWANMLGKAEGDTPDTAAALKAVPMLVKLVKEVSSAKSAVVDGKKWTEVYERIRPHVEEALVHDTPLTKKIRALWNLALAKTEGDRPDFAAGLKAVPMLIKLIKEADAAAAVSGIAQQGAGSAQMGTDSADPQPAMADADAASGGGGKGAGKGGGRGKPPAPDVAAADGDDSGPAAGSQDASGDAAPVGAPAAEADGVPDAVPADGADVPPADAPPADAAAADVPPADAVAADAPAADAPAADAPAAADVPADVAANLAGDDVAKLARIDTKLKSVDKLVTTYMALIPGSAETKPRAWVSKITKLQTYHTAMQVEDAELKSKKLDKALKDLAKLTNDINGDTAKKKVWKKALDLFNIRLLTLDHHPQSTEPEILPKVAKIKNKMAAAEGKANKQKFKGAIKSIGSLTTRCDTVELLADGCAHYKAVLASRQALIASTAGDPATGVAKIDKMKTQVTRLLTKAARDANADKFDDAVKKLDEIPPLHTEMRVQIESRGAVGTRGTYLWYVARIDPVFAYIDGLSAAEKAILEPGYSAFKQGYTDAKVAVTKDFKVSANAMLLFNMKEFPYYNGKSKAIELYFMDKGDFDFQLALFKAHAGRPGIEAFYLGMIADQKKADNEVKVNRFAAASALLNRSLGDWPKEEQRADDYVDYDAKLTTLTPILDGLRPKTAAANFMTQADALVATAAKLALARDYGKALAKLVEAEKRAADAKAAVEAADALAALKDSGALDDMATDFAAAYKVFTDMRANVAGKDGTGTFTTKIAVADTPAATSKAASIETPPNYTDARTHLDVAIAHLEDTLPRIMAYGPWKIHHTAINVMVSTTLPGVNLDNCIQSQIDDAKALVTDSASLAAAPGFNISGAEAKLAEAQVIIDVAASDAALYPTVKSDVAKIIAQKVLLALPANSGVAAFMGTRSGQINKYLTDVAVAVTAKKMKDAATEAAKGAALSDATTWDIKTGIEAIRRKISWYDPELRGVTGNAVCVPLITTAATKLASYTKDMAVPNFDAAQETIKPPLWDLMAAKELLTSTTAFTPKSAAAKAAIDSVKAVRNPGVEDELKVLETRYTEALKTGKAGNFHRATIEVDEIAVAGPGLVTKAGKYKPYEDARVTAKPKLDDALGHAQASSIQPMLTRLSAKYAAAEKLAKEGEYTAAKTMMTQIASDADAAIESADNCAKFELLTSTLDMAADTGILPPAVIATTQEVLDQLNKRPEAPSAQAGLTDAATQLVAARAGGEGAMAALKAAIAACEQADETMSQYRMLEQSVGRALARIAELKAHAQAAYIAPLLASVDTAVNGVLAKALASGDHVGEAASLDGHFTRMLSLMALADDYAKYLVTRAEPDVEAKVEVLEKHDHRYAIKASIDSMRSKLSQATEMAKVHLMEDALKRLEEVRALGLSAQVMADMRANTVPSVKDINTILAQPGGQAELDAMIDNLEPDAQRKVLRVAFEARFGCTLQKFVAGVDRAGRPVDTIQLDANLAGPNIKRFYELMSDLPPSDTIDNDSILLFSDKKLEGSKFDSGPKDVIMNEGQDEFSNAYGFGRDFEVGGGDPKYEPVDMEPVTRFSWNTLHEVGHAVDDKHGYMKKNGGKVDHGQWKDYGRDYDPVVQVFATKYKYDETYIKQFMLHSANIAIPDIPAGANACAPEEWERRRLAVTNHITLAQAKSRPWNSNAQAKQIAINGTVYQESYPNTWMSYQLDARKKGMTGYQFRAPGEWFSELYAAYHIGKMKPGHPAVEWLEKLG